MALALLFIAWLGLQATAGTETARVEGTVVDTATRLPIVGAEVQLNPWPTGPFQDGPVTVFTDRAGRFIFVVEAGQGFRLRVRANGYYGRLGAPDMFGPPLRADEPVSQVTIGLLPASSISGRVTNTDGDPVADIQVLLLRSVFNVDGNGRVVEAATTTNESGRYTFAVSPGRYFMVAGNPFAPEPSGRNLPRFARTFYPGVDDPRLAARIDLAPGASYPNAHLIVSPAEVRRVTGRVIDTRPGEPPARVRVDLLPALPFINYGADIAVPLRGAFDSSDGGFTFSDVPEGRYRVGVIVFPASQVDEPVSEWKMIEVAGRDVDLGRFDASRATSLSGRLTTVGGVPLSGGVRVLLDPAGLTATGGATSVNATLGDDAQFDIPNVIPGRYRVSLAQLEENGYVGRVRLNGVDVAGTLIDIPQGIRSVFEIEVDPNGGEILARIPGNLDEGSLLAAVLLPDPIPIEVGFHRREFVFPDAQPEFVLHGVPPGRYQIFVWDLQRPEGDPELSDLRQRSAEASRIDIRAGDRVAVDVRALED